MATLTPEKNDEDTAKEIAQLEDDFSKPAYLRPEEQEQQAVDEKVGEETAEEDEGGWVTNVKAKTKKKSSGKKKGLLIGAGISGSVGLVLVVLFLVMMFIGQLKAIHFATVLRSVGFATSQRVMKKAFSQIAINATTTPDSTGGVSAYQRSMLDRLRGINPDKTMKILNREGKWNVVTDKGTPIGFEVNGERFMQDDFAKELFPEKGGYDKLSTRERWTVKNRMADAAKELPEVLGVSSRRNANSFQRGFLDYFNIKGGKWAQKARELAGKTPKEAFDETRRATVEDISAGDKPRSILDGVNEAADGAQEALDESLKDGAKLRSGDYSERGFSRATRAQVGAFADGVGKVSDVVFFATIYCTAYDIQSSLEELNANKETQSQRNAYDIQTTADQIKSGEVNSQAVQAANMMWDGSENIPPADASPLYQNDIGKAVSGSPDALLANSPTVQLHDTALKGVLDAIEPLVVPILPPGPLKETVIKAGCDTILKPEFQVAVATTEIGVTIVASAVTGGGFAAAKAGVKIAVTTAIGIYGGNMLGEWMQTAISNYSGTDITGAETGVDKYNAGRITTDYMNSTVNRGVAYGRPLSKEEAISNKKVALAELKETEASKSFTHRYFAIDNPYSLTGTFAASAPTNMNSLALRTRASLAGVGNRFSALLSGSWGVDLALNATGLQQKVSAAAIDDVSAGKDFFGVDQWGWTPQEIYKIEQGDESFDVVANAGWVGERNVGGALDQKYEKCYKPEAQTEVPADGCDAATLGSYEALHWRLFKLHESVIDQINDTTITADERGGSESSLTGGTLGPDLPSGTEEELIQDIKDTGNILSGAEKLSKNMKRTILAVILKLAQKYKFTINSTIRSGAGPHGNGSAIDIGNINGAGVPTGQDYAAFNEEANQFVADAATLLPGRSWFGVSNDKFKATANPIMNPKGGSADLDIPSTTGATGAHFHLNVPADAE